MNFVDFYPNIRYGRLSGVVKEIESLQDLLARVKNTFYAKNVIISRIETLTDTIPDGRKSLQIQYFRVWY
jgi:hypothetical protein